MSLIITITSVNDNVPDKKYHTRNKDQVHSPKFRF